VVFICGIALNRLPTATTSLTSRRFSGKIDILLFDFDLIIYSTFILG
jgi:hypothetical protein